MFLKRLALVTAIVGAGLGASACTDGYGYSGVSLGYGDGYYGDGYYGDGYGYAGGYDPYGYGAGSYFGWYGDYYYPGTGVYVYDRYRRPYRWNDGQRRYWQGRGNGYRGNRTGNWGGFDHRGGNPGFNGGDRDGASGFQGRPGYQGNPGYRGQGYRGGRYDGQRPSFSQGQPATGATTPNVTGTATQPSRSFGNRGFGGNGGWRGAQGQPGIRANGGYRGGGGYHGGGGGRGGRGGRR